jgi:hypothetical protein
MTKTMSTLGGTLNTMALRPLRWRNVRGEPILPPVSVESILSHPRNKERAVLFEPIKHWKYEQGNPLTESVLNLVANRITVCLQK